MKVILSQRFLPEKGGSINWLINFFENTEDSISVITHLYPQTKSYQEQGNFKIYRSKILTDDWGLDSWSTLTSYYRMLIALLKITENQSEVEIYCARSLPEGMIACLLKLFRKDVRVNCFAHGEELLAYQSSRQLKFLFKLFKKWINQFIANSNNTKDLLEKSQVLPEKIKVIFPVINFNQFQVPENKQVVRDRLGISKDEIIILTVGRLCQRKNQLGVLQALSQVKTEQSFSYLMIGEGEAEESLVSYINSQDQAKFKIIKSVDNHKLIKYYQAADVFVMASKQVGNDIEGFGIVYLEAASCGLPIVAGNSGGEQDAVGDNGMFVSDQVELISALEKLINDPVYRQALARKSVEFVKKFK